MGRFRLATGILLFCSLLGVLANEHTLVNDFPELEYSSPEMPPSRNGRSLSVRVPANAVIVLHSLDLSGVQHHFEVSVDAVSEESCSPPAADFVNAFSNLQLSIPASPESQQRFAATVPEALKAEFAQSTTQIMQAPTPAACRCSYLRNAAQSSPVFTAETAVTSAAVQPAEKRPSIPARLRTFLAPEMVQGTICSIITQGTLATTIGNTAVYFSPEVLSELTDEHRTQILHRLEQFFAAGLQAQVAAQFGDIADLDGSGGLTLLIGRMQEQSAPAESTDSAAPPLLGAVRQSDFLDAHASPGGDIIYLDCNLPLGEELNSLLVHELSHAAICSRLRERGCSGSEALILPAWIHELLAHAGEHIIVGASDIFAARLRSFHGSPENSPICTHHGYQTLQSTRGGSRAAAIRLLQFAGGPQQHLRCALLMAESQTSFLEQILGSSLRRLLPQWSLTEAAEILREHPDTVRQLMTGQTHHCCIHGTGFAVLRLPNTATLLTVSSSAAADWTVTALPP